VTRPRRDVRSPLERARRVRKVADTMRRRLLHRHQVRLLTWLRHGRRHAAPIDPFRNLRVDPQAVTTWLDYDRDDFMRIRSEYGVRDGDWDLAAKPIGEQWIYDSVEAHFTRGVPWEETRVSSIARAALERGERIYHGCRTPSEIAARLEQLDALHDRMREEGYRSQRELADGEGGHPLQRRGSKEPELDEVIVSIGRGGAIIFVDGIHRFSLARVIGVPAIPVCVLTRHATWQAHRDRVARDPHAQPAAVFGHPDVVDLAP
jgi:hypothetical protein